MNFYFSNLSLNDRRNNHTDILWIIITDFTDENGVDRMKEQIQLNYNRINEGTKQIVTLELQRIKDDPALAHLLQQQE